MNKQELIEKFEERKTIIGNFQGYAVWWKDVKEIFEQLDEPQPAKVPQFVADWIEYFKKYSGSLYGSTAPYSYYGHAITDDFVGDVKKTLGWIRNNSETYARAWLDGYEVEKEKRYEVILCNGQSLKTVYRQGSDHLDFEMVYGDLESFTRKQLEEANFGWVFSCEGIEIEEVDLCH